MQGYEETYQEAAYRGFEMRALARKVHGEVELRVRLLGGPGDINRSMTPSTDQRSAVGACEKAMADLRRVVDDLLDAAHVHL